MQDAACHRHRAFTLVELLVVIGIIALLISILLPALSRATSATRRVVDMANLRQMAISAVSYTLDHDGSLPFGLVALDNAGKGTDDFTQVARMGATWIETLAVWTGDGEATAGQLWQTPAIPATDTPAYGANPVAMPAPFLMELRNTNHGSSEKAPAKLNRLYPDNALFWSSSAYGREMIPGPGAPGLGASAWSASGLPPVFGFSGIDDGLAYGLYSNRDTPQARYRDRSQPDPVGSDPLLAADASIRVFDSQILGSDNDRDFSEPLNLVGATWGWMPARFRFDGRCNVARSDGSVASFAKGRPAANGLYDTEFRRSMLKIKFP
jgi:prepilin-type N-terminal cleavage/methylation domain-containing protein